MIPRIERKLRVERQTPYVESKSSTHSTVRIINYRFFSKISARMESGTRSKRSSPTIFFHSSRSISYFARWRAKDTSNRQNQSTVPKIIHSRSRSEDEIPRHKSESERASFGLGRLDSSARNLPQLSSSPSSDLRSTIRPYRSFAGCLSWSKPASISPRYGNERRGTEKRLMVRARRGES